MSLANDVLAIRTAVALTDADHLVCAMIGGPDAHALLDRVSPRELFIRPGQMVQTLLLRDDGSPCADVYLCCDDDDYRIIADGLSGPELAAYLARYAAGLDVAVTDLSSTHAFLSLDGPYAWELLAELASPDVIGLPYLHFFHEGRFTCFRGGKTGEYGYDLLIERGALPAVRERLVAAGRGFELRAVSLDAIDRCALESGFFNIRRDAAPELTPIELQLQWRTSLARSFPGSEALAARRQQPRRRVTTLAAVADLPHDAPLHLDGQRIGTVIHGGRSVVRGEWIGLGLLESRFAHPGLGGLIARTADGERAARTISSPAVNNRSLYVDPQRHSWSTRAQETFPPLVRPGWS